MTAGMRDGHGGGGDGQGNGDGGGPGRGHGHGHGGDFGDGDRGHSAAGDAGLAGFRPQPALAATMEKHGSGR